MNHLEMKNNMENINSTEGKNQEAKKCCVQSFPGCRKELTAESVHNDEILKLNGECRAFMQFEHIGKALKEGTSCQEDVLELMKLGMDSLKNKTYNILLLHDKDYQKRFIEEQAAYRRLEKLNIPEEYRDIIDTYIARKDEAEYDRLTLSYIAGMLDNYEILKLFGLTNE